MGRLPHKALLHLLALLIVPEGVFAWREAVSNANGTSCKATASLLPGGLKPPITAQKVSESKVEWGSVRNDNYAWLQDKTASNPEILSYLEQENEFTELVLGGELADELEAEMHARIASTDQGVPRRVDQYLYFWYRQEDQQFKVHARRQVGEEAGGLTGDDLMDERAAGEILLDENELAEGHPGFSLGGLEISADHRRLAYTVDLTGEEQYDLYVKEVDTGKVTQLAKPGTTSGSMAWALDNSTLFYLTLTAQTQRPNKLWQASANDTAAPPQLLYEEPDEAFSLSLSETHNQQHILLYGESMTTKYVMSLSAAQPEGQWVHKGPKVHGRKYKKVEERQGEWLALVSDQQWDTLNAELLLLQNVTQATGPGAAASNFDGNATAKVLVPHSYDVELEDFEIFSGHLALMKRINGLSMVSTFTLDQSGSGSGLLGVASLEPELIDFDEESYSLQFGEQVVFNSSVLRIVYSSLITPDSTFDVDMTTGRRVLRKEERVLGSYRKDDYRAFRVWAESLDGTQVPISVVHKKGAVALDGTDALVLHVYGAYGIPSDADFDATRLGLLDRGVIFAIAHVRGGGDLGQYWYLDGKMGNKPNTFKDTVAAATHLIQVCITMRKDVLRPRSSARAEVTCPQEGYTSAGRLCLWGSSAGGLTVAAAINMRPDLFKAAVLVVPFVDVVSTMSDPRLPATVMEYEEWGNPVANQSTYDLMLSYSPMDNVKQQPYPSMLAVGGLHDSRVSYWEPAKWVAKTRQATAGHPVILLLTQMEAGHAGVGGVFSQLREVALEQAFLLRATCVAAPTPTQAAVTASKASQVCVPCIVYVCLAMAGFAGLIAGSLYYSGTTLASIWAMGRQRGLGLREVALQGFKRTGVNKEDVGGMEGEDQGGGNTVTSEAETQRLIAHEREP